MLEDKKCDELFNDPLALLALSVAIRVKPAIVWRLQRLDGSTCIEWHESRYADPEREARAYYAKHAEKSPENTALYEIKLVEILTDHGKICNEVASLLLTLPKKSECIKQLRAELDEARKSIRDLRNMRKMLSAAGPARADVTENANVMAAGQQTDNEIRFASDDGGHAPDLVYPDQFCVENSDEFDSLDSKEAVNEAVDRAMAALDEMTTSWAAALNINHAVKTMMSRPDGDTWLVKFIKQAYTEGLFVGRRSR